MGAKTCKTDCGCDQGDAGDDVRVLAQPDAKEVVDMTSMLPRRPARAPPEAAPAGARSSSRREPFEVTIVRQGQQWRTLGLVVSPDDDPKYLVIDDIWEPSLVGEYNKLQKSKKFLIRPRDLITSVNGSICDGEGMLNLIQSTTRGACLKLRVRPANGEG
ncbi:unnamed protein product [Prorocentrum cordatum]|uniref:PDZ domain-containing protein n=1 Tax=Prorocentrum cordatum TaxID=2364126 RepID=A0ABN9VQV7_9DINO|nr:unnamed protein product [Polarella glacialis]|mmetsp:Transcript_23636/g.63236  ORF Transcript_23636/g.63236 Transcript_23636/m.63236 type:complete len:160 (-) Transcript_23636:150-629(-)